jgi:nicotinate phosphoribosyltransferase
VDHSALATDLYQLTMAAGYEAAGIADCSTFELFVRKLPERRGFLVAAGLRSALDWLERFHFSAEDIAYLRQVPALARVDSRFFDEVLPALRFTGDVWAMREGEVVFAREPIVRVTAPAAEAQLVETALLAIVTFQTTIASKGARVVLAAGDRQVVEFGSRRAHGPDAARDAARAAYLAGCVGTSNVEAGACYGIPVSGTMAHSWVMTFADEMTAFRAYMDLFGAESTLLIDTYDTVRAAEAIVEAGLRPGSVRLDSGDLDALSRRVRGILDSGGLTATRIIASGDLDEYRIARLVQDDAPIDAFGVGTSLSTSRDEPALGGVYKLVAIDRAGNTRPVMKLSSGKATLPGIKQVWRQARDGQSVCDTIGVASESRVEGRPLLEHVMHDGRKIRRGVALADLRDACIREVCALPQEVRAIEGWEPYDVQVSAVLADLAASVGQQLS